MCFPEKNFFYLEQLEKRWGANNVSISDIQHAITCDELIASIFIKPTFVAKVKETTDSGEYVISSHASKIQGFINICPEDCHELFFEGVIDLRRFRSNKNNFHYVVPESFAPIKLHQDRLEHLNRGYLFVIFKSTLSVTC